MTVSFDLSSGFAAEGGTTKIWVELSADPQREVVIPITVTERGGASSADYSSVPSSVTFSTEECYDSDYDTCYETYKSVTFAATEDSDDDGESVQLGIGSPLPAGVTLGKIPTATVWIIDGGWVNVGLAQVGVGVNAHLFKENESGNFVALGFDNVAWQWQRSAAEDGPYSNIPEAEGGPSNPYIPSAGDLGMWLKAKVTYDDGGTGKTAQSPTQRALSQPVLSNAGQTHHNLIGFVYSELTNAPVRAGVHDRFGHPRLPAVGSTPRACIAPRHRGRDVGGACRRRWQAGGRAAVGSSTNPGSGPR